MPDEYECPPITIGVANGNALDFGWRIREMRLYSDDMCQMEVSPGTSSQYTESAAATTCTGSEVTAYAGLPVQIIIINNLN